MLFSSKRPHEPTPILIRKDTSELVRVLGHGLMIWGAVNQLFTNSRMLMERSGKRIGCRLWALKHRASRARAGCRRQVGVRRQLGVAVG